MSHMDDSTDYMDPASKRASFYALNQGAGRDSIYDSSNTLEYNPRPASSHNYLGSNSKAGSKLSGHGLAQLVDARQSYGDVRKSANVVSSQVPGQGQRRGSRHDTSGPTGMYDEFDQSPAPYGVQQTYSISNVRDRSKGRTHARDTSREVVYDRY